MVALERSKGKDFIFFYDSAFFCEREIFQY